MRPSRLASSLLCLMALAMIHITCAQNTPQAFLDPHNVARAAVGVGPLSWNATVAAYAQSYANVRKTDCQLILSGGPYGENLYVGSTTTVSAAAVVGAWVAGKQYYDYSTNTCTAGQDCAEYTQVVWANSVNLGCYGVICDSGQLFVICSYYPPGNVPGERPY